MVMAPSLDPSPGNPLDKEEDGQGKLTGANSAWEG